MKQSQKEQPNPRGGHWPAALPPPRRGGWFLGSPLALLLCLIVFFPLDASAHKYGSLGDRVWEDLNGNGLQDEGEPNVDGAQVKLYKSSDGVCDGVGETFVTSQFTSSAPDPSGEGGNYLFSQVSPSFKYCVKFIAPHICNGKPATFTKANVGTNAALDSDADPKTGWAGPFQLTDYEKNLTVDAGVYCPAAVGDFVWNDTNENGIQDTGEPGIPGVKVDLLTCDGKFVATTDTDANGKYLFSGLAPGSYSVRFEKPEGFVFSTLNVGDDRTIDSDAQSNGQTACFDLASGETNLTIDAGLYVPVQATAQLGDFVWHDLNADGIQNAGEPGIAGATVQLFTCPEVGDGKLLATTTTDAHGNYLFAGLLPGDYSVQFVKPDDFLLASPVLQGGNPELDSDADPTTGRTRCVALAEGESNLTLDAGFYNPAALGDFVWNDLNQNGIQDASEPGIPGVTVKLFTCKGVEVDGTTTDGSGLYSFAGLTPGSYSVRFEAPAGFEFTQLNAGTDITVDSDAQSNGQTACVTLKSGETNQTIDAGLFVPATAQLGDFVWHDLNADGIQQAFEPGIAGATVELFQCGGSTPIATATTNANGLYLFDDLAAGSYQVKFTRPAGFEFGSPQEAGADRSRDSNPDPMTGLTACIGLAQGESNLTIDAGFYKPAALGDFVWNDLNQNGIQDMGEPGIPGVVVNLYTCEGEFLTGTTTDGEGLYGFTGLMPDSYYVLFEAPAGFVFSPQFQGDPAKDSNANPTNGQTPCVTLISGQTDNTIDAGLYMPVMNPGTGSRGYWTNHPNAWPVDEITIGGVTYTKSQAIAEIRTPPRGDATRILFPQLIAAKLNVIIGNDASCIAATIAAADAWMAQYGPVGSGVRSSSAAWSIGEPLYKLLDDYNNGLLCAPSRDVVKHR